MFPRTTADLFSRALPLVSLGVLLTTGCTPYAVHTSAQPLLKGENTSGTIFTVVPGGARIDDSTSRAMPSLDWEKRMGLDDRSDVGLRINSFSGAIVTYKRRLDGKTSEQGVATSLMVGAGFVNVGEHAHGEITLVTSATDSGRTVIPYGGVRAIQIVPLSTTAVHDKPTIGVFGGTRLGSREGGISVELGVFYDRSALGLRRNDVVFVPSIAFHGLSFRRMFSGIVPQTPAMRPCAFASGCVRNR
jgi:hypothetical protein